MSRAEELWERLVRTALRRERFGMSTVGQPAGGIAGYVPSSIANDRDIYTILRLADEIQDEEPNHAYSFAQNLDPNSEGRGVLPFKTGLMSVIKLAFGLPCANLCSRHILQIGLAKGPCYIHIPQLPQINRCGIYFICTSIFTPYVLGQQSYHVQKLGKREVGTIDSSQDIARLQEFYMLYREKNNVDKLREEEMMLRESGVFSGNLGELGLPKLPSDFSIPDTRSSDLMDFLHYVFGFQFQFVKPDYLLDGLGYAETISLLMSLDFLRATDLRNAWDLYGIVYKLDVLGTNTSLTVFTFSQKISVNFQLLLRFIQGLSFLLVIAGLAAAVVFTDLTIPDIFACILAFVPTGWGILSIAAAWKPLVKKDRVVEINSVDSTIIRCWNGNANIRPR
ncbi:hypothetical protein F3Y22_tig00111779pilonHSYRG00222 [Hibiscus syriacus]|uniref:Uncharacterized protein n=1 Tax=Hibiscus syriacus TaxID=106335 RepID=A0A6A2XE59_HIBSY|nr:hypothetical protein F3Y22_tig00111779pilonHSYRG00222 [Hibiscus syriacus]